MAHTEFKQLRIWKSCWLLAGLVHEQSAFMAEPAGTSLRRLALSLLGDLERFFAIIETEDKPEAMLVAADTLLKLEEEIFHLHKLDELSATQWVTVLPQLDVCKNLVTGYHAHYSSLVSRMNAVSDEEREISNFQTQLQTSNTMNTNTEVNAVSIIGRTGVNPRITNFKSGLKRATFVVASFQKPGHPEELSKKTNWVKIVAYGYVAEQAEKYLSKGQMLSIQGKISDRDTTDSKGNVKTVTEVVAHSLRLISPDKKSAVKKETVIKNIQLAQRKAG